MGSSMSLFSSVLHNDVRLLYSLFRTGVVKMLENSKRFFCPVCKQQLEVLADVEQYNQVIPPSKCSGKNNGRPCQGNRLQMIETPPGMELAKKSDLDV